jgi:hypothetical protein
VSNPSACWVYWAKRMTCMYVCVYRLVKQLVEVPSCHVTTLRLAGNTLQVHT